MEEDLKKVVRKINSEKKKREEDLKKAYHRQYFYRIHNETLGIILNKIKTEDYVTPVIQSLWTHEQRMVCILGAHHGPFTRSTQ